MHWQQLQVAGQIIRRSPCIGGIDLLGAFVVCRVMILHFSSSESGDRD